MSDLTESQIQRINAIMSEVNKLDEHTVVEQWEPKFLDAPKFGELGISRNSKKGIKSALIRMEITEKLARLVHELDGEAEYGDDDSCYIYINSKGFMKHSRWLSSCYPEVVLMTRKCAKKICKMHKYGRLDFLNPPVKE